MLPSPPRITIAIALRSTGKPMKGVMLIRKLITTPLATPSALLSANDKAYMRAGLMPIRVAASRFCATARTARPVSLQASQAISANTRITAAANAIRRP